LIIKPNKAKIGKELRDSSKDLLQYFDSLVSKREEALELQKKLDKGGSVLIKTCDKEFKITSDMVKISVEEKKVAGRNYIPAVIEPSFGIGRIMYAVMEHAYAPRGDAKTADQDGVLAFTAPVAPVKVTLCPLSGNEKFTPTLRELARQLTAFNLANLISDSSVSIGRRYARSDEIGVPFAIAVDFQTLEDKTVTIRERDSTNQIRVTISDAVLIIAQLVTETITWEQAYSKYPKFFRPDSAE